MNESSLLEQPYGRHALVHDTPETARTDVMSVVEADRPVTSRVKNGGRRSFYVPIASLAFLSVVVGSMDTRPTVEVHFEHEKEAPAQTSPATDSPANVLAPPDNSVTGADIASLHGGAPPMDNE